MAAKKETVSTREALQEQAARELMTYRAKYATVLKWTGADQEISKAIELMQNGVEA